MKLEKTVVIPSEDNDVAKGLFKSLVHEEDVLLVIVLGNDEKAKKAVKCADLRAQSDRQSFKRKVAWFLDKNVFKLMFENEVEVSTGDSDFSANQVDQVVAISISLTDTIRDVVNSSEKIDFFRMELAFLAAEKKEQGVI